jgi:hypothetical protein
MQAACPSLGPGESGRTGLFGVANGRGGTGIDAVTSWPSGIGPRALGLHAQAGAFTPSRAPSLTDRPFLGSAHRLQAPEIGSISLMVSLPGRSRFAAAPAPHAALQRTSVVATVRSWRGGGQFFRTGIGLLQLVRGLSCCRSWASCARGGVGTAAQAQGSVSPRFSKEGGSAWLSTRPSCRFPHS